MKKRTWIMIGLIVVAAGGIFLATRSNNNQPAATTLLAGAQTAPVIRTTLVNLVEASGSISAQAVTSLSFGVSGTVRQVNVTVGDRVAAGDVLAVLDTTDLELKVAQAEQAFRLQEIAYRTTVEADPADVAAAQASYNSALAAYNAARTDYANLADKQAVQCSQLTTAQDALDRAQIAYDRLANDHQASQYLSGDWGPFQSVVDGLTNAQSAYDLAVANCNLAKVNLNDTALKSAQVQLQNARNTLTNLIAPRREKLIQAEAQLEQARLSLEQARRQLDDAQIVAPHDGVVTAVNITAGGDSSGAAITLADVSELHVDVLVDETLIAQVKPGQTVDLTLDAMTGVTLTGTVARIDPVGTVTQGVVNYTVRVNLNPIASSAPVRLDMTANAAILGERRENVLAVPSSAIRSLGGGQGGLGGALPLGREDQSGAGGQGQRQGLRQGSFVLVIENGQPRPVPVTVGLTAGDLTEVSGDLSEGDQVLVGTLNLPTGNANFRPGGFFPGGGPGGGGPPPF